MRCPACGARNPDRAAWCSQCFRTLGEEESEPTSATASPPPSVPRSTVAAEEDGRFRSTEEGVDWRCASCDAWNPIEVSRCTVCGTGFRQALRADEEARPSRDVPVERVLAATVVLPGSGHLLLGRTATGLGRAVLYVVWAVGGVVLLRAAGASGQSALPAVPLLLGALVLLVTSVVDALALQRRDDQELLTPRVLLWLTVGVIGLTMLTLLASALTVTT